ncbi:unnamed protein product, partial [Ixodes hexagonus]
MSPGIAFCADAMLATLFSYTHTFSYRICKLFRNVRTAFCGIEKKKERGHRTAHMKMVLVSRSTHATSCGGSYMSKYLDLPTIKGSGALSTSESPRGQSGM